MDTTKNQVEHFLQQWHKRFVYSIVYQDANLYQIKVMVDPELVSMSGLNKDVRAELKIYIQTVYNATVMNYDGYEAVVNVPKPIFNNKINKELTLSELKEDIHDRFAEVIDHRHFYFKSSDVDYALTQPGGIVERTKAQALSMIKNKLDD
jgi:hypothetical protein